MTTAGKNQRKADRLHFGALGYKIRLSVPEESRTLLGRAVQNVTSSFKVTPPQIFSDRAGIKKSMIGARLRTTGPLRSSN